MNKSLHHLYLFKGLSPSDLELVENIAELAAYAPDQKIFSQGDSADSFYVIQHGVVRIYQEEEDEPPVEIATYGTGSHFGEMAFLDNLPRSATATALAHSDMICIRYDAMKTLLDSQPHISIYFYRELAKFLCSRLRLTTLDLSNARSENAAVFL